MKHADYSVDGVEFAVWHLKDIRKQPGIYYYNPEDHTYHTAAVFKSEEYAEKFVGWLGKLAHAKVVEVEK